MAEDTGRGRGQDVTRLITFADAVVAIAITLLALPLVDLSAEAVHGFARLVDLAAYPLLGFTISFFVIARLWWAHHRIYEHVERWDTRVVALTVVWLFSVVLLSATTSITTGQNPFDEQWPFVLYTSVMTLCGGLMLLQALHVHRHPELTDGGGTDSLRRVVGSAETVAGFALALVIGTLLPQVNYFAFLVLLFTGRLDGVVLRRIESRRR